MKKLGVLLIIISLTIIFGACPPLEEDDPDSIYFGNVVNFEEPFELDVYKWFEILDKVAKERRYVSLDLSKGILKEGNTVGGLIKLNPLDPLSPVAFDPFPAAASGKNYILSIILPAGAQMIKQAIEDNAINDDFNAKEKDIENAKKFSAFRAFTNLRSVKAENVTLIGNFAFSDCTELTEVNFPRVGHTATVTEQETLTGYYVDIGKYAFTGCTGLKEIKFNSAAVIGEYAFKGCTSLSKIDFPEVWMIERNAFEGCKSLVNVFFEKASKIGEEAFKNCAGLKKAEFNVKPSQIPVSNPVPATPNTYPDYYSVIFYPSVFTGCKALEVLNVRRAWNVYFSKDVLANTSSTIEIYLFDADDTTSYGHPQNADFLGPAATATLKKVDIFVPVSNGKIQKNSNTSDHNILNHIVKTYNKIDANVNQRTL